MSTSQATRNFNDLLFHVAEKTFGELAFLLIELDEIAESKHLSAPNWTYAVYVEFTGPFGGAMHIAITENMLRPLATNMLGIDVNEQLPEGVKLEDALKELLNVTCGNLLPIIGGDEAVFRIGAPELLPEPTPPAGEKTPVGQVQLILDAGMAQVTLYLDPGTRCNVMVRDD
jgi:hypothetical protein